MANVARDPSSRDPSETGADLLNACHERVNQRHCPEHGIAKLCAHAGVCCDPAWIIIGGAGHQGTTTARRICLSLT